MLDARCSMLDAEKIAADSNFSATAVTTYTDNLAAEVAVELTGKTATDLRLAWNNSLVTTGAALEALFERTVKGGIHGIVSLLNQQIGHRGRFQCPGIMEYNAAHQNDHQFALFMHDRVTRIGEGTSAQQSVESIISTQVSPSANRLIISRLPNAISDNPGLHSQLSDKAGTDLPPTVYYQDRPVFVAASGFGTLVNNACKSWVLYRCHLVDVTASGIAFAELTAAEQQLLNVNFGTGGKYAGDTIPTSPSALP
ncbi:Uncharacterised protein [Raoultella terrigena]|uniref:Uncharacterized protein n=1 Tax=Raoultella terrigena TaxID=577 RepID=A0A3P8L061_RAOTE|nr:Uncharacterised protein [Raoultella terrigena]